MFLLRFKLLNIINKKKLFRFLFKFKELYNIIINNFLIFLLRFNFISNNKCINIISKKKLFKL